MSVSVNIRTSERLDPQELFQVISEDYARLIVASDKFPSLKFGEQDDYLRGIEVNEEADGYEVRICIGSNEGDYLLFGETIGAIESLTGGTVIGEDDEEIDEPADYFDDDWVEKQMRSDCNLLYTMFRPSGEAIICYGLFVPICFGFQVLSIGDNDMFNPDFDKYKHILDYLSIIQQSVSDSKPALHGLEAQKPKNESETKSITSITIKDRKVRPFDFVPYSNLLALVNGDSGKSVVIPFEKLRYISRERGLHQFDDYQCGTCPVGLMYKTHEEGMSLVDAMRMMSDAQRFALKDWFFKPTYPGCGYDKKQKTYVLMWDPNDAESDVSEEDFKKEIAMMWPDRYDLVWDMADIRKAKMFDRFFLVRTGQVDGGIVMTGIFGSHTYFGAFPTYSKSTFWSILQINFIVDSGVHPIITTKQLEIEMPDINWRRPRGSFQLTDGQAEKLESIFSPYFDEMKNKADGKTLNATHYLSAR